MIFLAEKDARRVGERCRRRRQFPSQRFEYGKLRLVGRMLRFIGAGQMAHHKPDRDPVESIGVRRQSVDLGWRQAKPRHAAVDLQRRHKRAPGALGSGAPGLDLVDAVQHRHGAGCDARVFAAGRNAVEHMDFDIGPERGAQRQRLAELRDEECPAAFCYRARPPRSGAPRP